MRKNPDGIGFNDGLLPCIEDPNRLVASKKDKPEPAGFSPLYPMLPQRMKYQGTYDGDYKNKYFPGYPEDHDWKYFLCAPSDQWIKNYYQGNESFALYNMHPEIPLIEGSLPGLYARCFINHEKGGKETFDELSLNLDTIWFFPDKLLGLLIFRGVREVEDDEAESITHVVCACEDSACKPRSLEYYRKAFETRRNSDDALLTNFNTYDLIPDGHRCAMEILMDTALSDYNKSAFSDNMDAKAKAMQQMVDEKTEEAICQVEENIKNVDIPDGVFEHIPDGTGKYLHGKEGSSREGGLLNIRELISRASDAPGDSDVEKFNLRLETIMPGLTSGDPKKLDMKDFSFDKIDEIMDAVKDFTGKKEIDARNIADNELKNIKEKLKEDLAVIDRQMDEAGKTSGSGRTYLSKAGQSDSGQIDVLDPLEDARQKIQESLKNLDEIDLDGKKKSPIPRVDAQAIIDEINQMEPLIDSQIMEAMQHVQSMKDMGIEDERTHGLEKDIQRVLEDNKKNIEEKLREAQDSFKESYIMAAHFMDEGISPHKKSLEDVRSRFLEAVSNNENLSGGDFACIDLAGMNLDGINLSGAFLEQVNFKGASLKGANFAKAILARATFEDADLSGANFEGANVGAVNAHGANFSDSNFKSAKLSKGDFSGADFSKAILEDIESLQIIINGADFTRAFMPKVIFLETDISDAKFIKTDMNTTVFIKCSIAKTDFSQALMGRCAFVDMNLNSVCFDGADLSNACFASVDPEKSTMENLTFKGASLKQVNFQNLNLQRADFTDANLENAFLGGADLSHADLSRALAKNAQFRKAKLSHAVLDDINLMEGSLGKAHLTGASFKRANLYQVDFLRAFITDTDFSATNLDDTLIENWRPR